MQRSYSWSDDRKVSEGQNSKRKQEIELSEFAGDTENDSDDNGNEESEDMVNQVQSPSFTKVIEITNAAFEWFQSLSGKQKMFCYSFVVAWCIAFIVMFATSFKYVSELEYCIRYGTISRS